MIEFKGDIDVAYSSYSCLVVIPDETDVNVTSISAKVYTAGTFILKILV